MNAAEFNARYKVGTLVFAYPGCRPEDYPNDRRLVTRTRSQASLLGGHTDVVWVDGHSSCIALSHVDPVSEPVWQAAKEAEAAAEAEKAAKEAADKPQPLSDERLAEYVALVKRTTPAGAVTASPGILTVLLDEVRRLKTEQASQRVYEQRLREQHDLDVAELNNLRARLRELERPAIEAKRAEIRQSYTELIAQAEQDRDYEGAFDVQCRLRDREDQWAREDAADTQPETTPEEGL